MEALHWYSNRDCKCLHKKTLNTVQIILFYLDTTCAQFSALLFFKHLDFNIWFLYASPVLASVPPYCFKVLTVNHDFVIDSQFIVSLIIYLLVSLVFDVQLSFVSLLFSLQQHSRSFVESISYSYAIYVHSLLNKYSFLDETTICFLKNFQRKLLLAVALLYPRENYAFWFMQSGAPLFLVPYTKIFGEISVDH